MKTAAVFGFTLFVTIGGCSDDEVPDISGSYTCSFETSPERWCPDQQHPHIVRPKLTIVQQLPGSGMALEIGEAKGKGSVGTDGMVHAKAELQRCVGCNSANLFLVELDAKVGDRSLVDVVVQEIRHGRLPEPQRSTDFFSSTGFESHDDDCRAVHRGTCTHD